MLKEAYPDELSLKDNIGENALYKKRIRYFKKLSEANKVPITNYTTCNKERFQLEEFFFKYRFNRRVRKSDTESLKAEHQRPFKKDIFDIMFGYKLPRDNNYGIKEFRKDLEKIDIIYNDIDSNSNSWFERCLKYSECEKWLHYEASYKFVYAMEQREMFSTEVKTAALYWESALRHVMVAGENRYINFPLLNNIDSFIEIFFDEMENDIGSNRVDKHVRPNDCSRMLAHLTETCMNVVNYIIDEIEDIPNFHVSGCMAAEDIFKNYIGRGQHITKNKYLHDVFVEDLREIYMPVNFYKKIN